MGTNTAYDPSFNLDEYKKQLDEKKSKGLVQAGEKGQLNTSLFTAEQINAGVPESIATPKNYKWDKLIEDDKFINIMRDFYEIRDNIEFNEDSDLRNRQDIVDYFVDDRTWRQANITSMLALELPYVLKMTKEDKEGKVSQKNIEQMQRLYYGMNYWQQLGLDDNATLLDKTKHYSKRTLHNMYAGLMDSTNLASLGVGAVVTKTAGKTAVAQTVAFTLNQFFKKYATKTIAPVVAFDSASFAAANLSEQKKLIELGLQENIDYKQTGKAAIYGAGLTVLPSGVAGYVGVKSSLVKNRKIPTNPLIQAAEKAVLGTTPNKKYKSIIGTYGTYVGGSLDKFNPWKIAQQNITGVAGSVKGLKKNKKGIYLGNKGFTTIIDDKVYYAPATDPVALAYFQWRLTTASTTRAHHATGEDGVLMIPEKGTLKNDYVPTKNPGTNIILKPFDEVGEAENFLVYVAAKRAYHMHQMNKIAPDNFTPFQRDFPQGKDALEKGKQYINIPFSERQAKAIIDRAEMSKEAYKETYGIELDRTLFKKNGEELSFTASLQMLKAHTDDLLELQLKAGILNDSQVASIKAANPDGFIPFYSKKEDGTYSATPSNVVGVGSKAKKKTKKGTLKKDEEPEIIQINGFYDSLLDYTYSTVIAADRNIAKQASYDLLDAGVETGYLKLEKDGTYVHVESGQPVFRKIPTTEVKYQNLLEEDIINQLQKSGYKVTKDDVNELAQGANLQGATFVSSLSNKNDGIIDIVYRNGNPEFYKVIDPAFVNMHRDPLFANYLQSSPKLQKAYTGLKLFTKVPSKLITLSPRFAAKNTIRDTFTGVINSQFGFIPIWSTGYGFAKTFAGFESFQTNKGAYKKFIGMFERSQMYKDFLRQGGGFSSRNQTEKFFDGPKWEMYLSETGGATKDYKKTINAMKKFFYKNGKTGADGWAEFIGRLEYSSRLAEFAYAKRAGLSGQAAAFAGREISTDFGMSGSNPVLKMYSENTMFFNAGLQGFYKMSRSMADSPIKAGILIGGVFVAPEIAMWTLLNGREEYEELSDEFKMQNYVYPVFKEGEYHSNGDQVIDHFHAWPRPFDYQFAPNIARGILEGIKRENPYGTSIEYALMSFREIMPGFAAPTAINPFLGLLMNQNWQGDTIVPHYLVGKSPDIQVKKTTRLSAVKISEGIKFLSEYTGFPRGKGKEGKTLSPIVVDYIMNTFMAGLGQVPLDLIDAGIYEYADRYETVDGKKVDVLGPKPEKRLGQVDIVNDPMSFVTSTFKVDTPIINNERVNKFYQIYNDIKKIDETEIKIETQEQLIRNLKKVLLGDAEHQMDNASMERQELNTISPTFDAVIEMLKLQKQEKAAIEVSKEYSAQEKADKILKIDESILETIRIVIRDVRELNLETIDTSFFGKEVMTNEAMDILNSRNNLEKGVKFVNKQIDEQTQKLFNRF